MTRDTRSITDRLNDPEWMQLIEVTKQWTHRGYDCLVLRMSRHVPNEWEWQMTSHEGFAGNTIEYVEAVATDEGTWRAVPGYYNGYVQFPGFEDLHVHNPPVYGGLTYGPDSDDWIGFDTCHQDDLHRGHDGRFFEGSCYEYRPDPFSDTGPNVWDPEDVVEETEYLVEWLADEAESR